MAFLDNLIENMAVAKVKLEKTAETIAENNKKQSQMRKLRGIIKRENEIMAQAYESLGKIFYDKMTDEEKLEYKSFCNVIEDSQKNIEYAKIAYLAIEKGSTPAEIQKIRRQSNVNSEVTVACSNEEEYKKSSESPALNPKKNESEATEEVAKSDLF